jgi:hypothetical protein
MAGQQPQLLRVVARKICGCDDWVRDGCVDELAAARAGVRQEVDLRSEGGGCFQWRDLDFCGAECEDLASLLVIVNVNDDVRPKRVDKPFF